MNRAFVMLVAAGGLAGAVSAARADDGGPNANPVVEAQGYPVGEHAEFHPVVGAETGFTDNVFYDNLNLHPSGILRLIAEGAITSKKIEKDDGADGEAGTADADAGTGDTEAAAEPAQQSVQFRAGGRVSYIEYLSTNAVTRSQRNVGADLVGNLVVAPEGTFSFMADDRLVRSDHPTNFFSTDGVNRDINALALALTYQPGGHVMKGTVRWDNQIDYFEDQNQRFGNRMINTLAAHYDWMFFPYSKAYADFSWGFISPFSSSSGMPGTTPIKRGAQPIRGGVGIATAITEMFTVKAHVGWAYATYSGGSDGRMPTSYNIPVLGFEVGYRYSPLGRAVVEYNWDHQDSINGDFYRDHMIRGHVDQQIGRIVATLAGNLGFRRYEGVPLDINTNIPVRDDILIGGTLRANYVFRDWLAAVAEATTETDRTAYRSMFGGDFDNPGYTRNEVTVGVRAAF